MRATRRPFVGTGVVISAGLAMVLAATAGCGSSNPKGDVTTDANTDANTDAIGSYDQVGLAEVAIGSDVAEVSTNPDAAPAETGEPDAPADAILDTSDASTLADGADADASPGTPNLVYTTRITAGGYNRLYLKVNDTARDVCLQILLQSPAPTTPLPSATGLSVPAHFGVARVSLHSGTVCGTAIGQFATGTNATEATGQITWGRNGILTFPCTLEIHATVTFPAAPPLVYQLSATNVPVNACS
jgi:hypothetical protein